MNLLKNEAVAMLEIIGGEHVEIKKTVQLVKEHLHGCINAQLET